MSENNIRQEQPRLGGQTSTLVNQSQDMRRSSNNLLEQRRSGVNLTENPAQNPLIASSPSGASLLQANQVANEPSLTPVNVVERIPSAQQ